MQRKGFRLSGFCGRAREKCNITAVRFHKSLPNPLKALPLCGSFSSVPSLPPRRVCLSLVNPCSLSQRTNGLRLGLSCRRLWRKVDRPVLFFLFLIQLKQMLNGSALSLWEIRGAAIWFFPLSTINTPTSLSQSRQHGHNGGENQPTKPNFCNTSAKRIRFPEISLQLICQL